MFFWKNYLSSFCKEVKLQQNRFKFDVKCFSTRKVFY